MDGAVREVEKERFGRVRRSNLVDHVQRLIGEIVGEVVVVGVLVDREVMVVLVEPMGLVEVGEAVEDPVVPFEALLQRPAVAGAGVGQVGVFAEVPLPDHERRPPVVSEHLGHRDGVVTQLMRIPREPGIAVGDVPHAGHVKDEAGQHRRPSR